MEPTPRLCRTAGPAHPEWHTVHAFLGCGCTDADPAACTGTPADHPGAGPCGPAPTHHQCSCHQIRTQAEYHKIRTAVAARELNASQVLHDFSAAADRSPHPDGGLWAEALKWASTRIRGGHESMLADQDFGERFGTHPYRASWAQPDPPL